MGSSFVATLKTCTKPLIAVFTSFNSFSSCNNYISEKGKSSQAFVYFTADRKSSYYPALGQFSNDCRK